MQLPCPAGPSWNRRGLAVSDLHRPHSEQAIARAGIVTVKKWPWHGPQVIVAISTPKALIGGLTIQ
jgi:hypothetical protein